MRPVARAVVPLLLALAAAVAARGESPTLSLEEALTLAGKSSEAIRLSRLALEKSQAALGEAWGRALPHLDFEASGSYLVNPPPGYTVTRGQLAAPPLSPFNIPTSDITIGAALHNYFSLTATLNQPLFTWGKIRNAIDLASLAVDAAGTDVSARQRDIDWQVRRSYFSAVLARRSRDVLQGLRDTASLIVKDRQKGFDQGTLNRESLLEAEATLASLEAKLTEAEQSESTALTGLAVLTGKETNGIGLSTDFSAALPALDEESLLARALGSAPDMSAARARIEQARRKLAIEQGGALLHPDVNLGISLDITGQEDFPYSGAWTFSNNTWNVDVVLSLGVKMSAFDGMESLHRIEQAEKDVDMAGVALSQQAKSTRLQVRQAIEAARRADADAKAASARSAYLAEKLRNADVALANGQVSTDEERGASLQAGSAGLDLLLALYNRDAAIADIQRIAGALP